MKLEQTPKDLTLNKNTEIRAIAVRGDLSLMKNRAGNPKDWLNLKHAMLMRRY